jgi:TldD protein
MPEPAGGGSGAVAGSAPGHHADWGAVRSLDEAAVHLERALDACRAPGTTFAEARLVECEELRHDASLAGTPDRRSEHDLGVAVRVLVDGVWGFAARPLDGERTALDTALAATASARAAGGAGLGRIVLPPQAASCGTYVTDVAVDPFVLDAGQMERLLGDAVEAAAQAGDVRSAQAGIHAKRQHRYLCNSEGSRQAQHLLESGGGIVALAARDGMVQRRSYPNSFHGGTAGRGWEYVEALDLVGEAARVGEEAAALLVAPQADADVADLVIGPAQMALQIHESVGHALELDRILGDERNFAGSSFVTTDDIGSLVFASPAVTITADPTVAGTRGSFAFDDEGTPARRTDLIEAGILREYLSHRDSAARVGRPSSGAARADGWSAPPVCFATNVFLQPGQGSVEELLERMGDGYYLDDNRSWSIDSRRWNFQFGTEAAWEVRKGRRTRLLRNFSYTGVTPDFWGSVEAVAGPATFRTFGMPCGKGEPKQWGFLAHGAAPTLVRNVRVGVTP